MMKLDCLIVASFMMTFRLFRHATYIKDGTKKVLFLDGSDSYGEVPAADIRTGSFTVTCWIKMPAYPAIQGAIYADWSNPHQFRIYVDRHGRFCTNLRRAGPNFDMISAVGG